MFLHCLQPTWPFFEQKKMIWKFTIFDLRRSFSRSRWPRRSNLMTYLESSRQDGSHCMVKCLKKASWKIDVNVKFSAADISKTKGQIENFGEKHGFLHIKRIEELSHMQNFSPVARILKEIQGKSWRKTLRFFSKNERIRENRETTQFPTNEFRGWRFHDDIWDDSDDLLISEKNHSGE